MLRTLNDYEKCVIGATDGHVGHVKDLYFDDHTWVVRYLIVDTGSWLLDRKVLISPMSIQKADWPAHTLAAAITKEQVENSPAIDTDQPVSRQHELQYLGYYGYPSYWGGVGMWGAGMYPFAVVPAQTELPLGAVAREHAIAGAQAQQEQHRDDDPHLRSCSAVVGYHIHATDGEVGHVDGFLVDDETWAIRYVVVNTSNWWVGHKVLIAPQWIEGVQWSDETVTVDLNREKVKAAPPYDPDAVLDRPREAGLYSHYDRAPYWNAGSTSEREI